MTSDVDHHTPLAFTVAMSFLMGIVTTIAVYSLRNEPTAGLIVTEVHASTAATAVGDASSTAGAKDQRGVATPEPAATVPPAPSRRLKRARSSRCAGAT